MSDGFPSMTALRQPSETSKFDYSKNARSAVPPNAFRRWLRHGTRPHGRVASGERANVHARRRQVTVPHADVVKAAKVAPDTITYASGVVGSSGHSAAELFARRAGIRLVHVPYRGSAPATQALVAGKVQLLWDTPTSTMRTSSRKGRLSGNLQPRTCL